MENNQQQKYQHQHTPSASDENEIKSWGLGLGQGHKGDKRGQPKFGQPMTKAQIEQLAQQAEKDALVSYIFVFYY